MISPLSLKHYRVTYFHLEANEDFEPKRGVNVDHQIGFDFEVFKTKDSYDFMIPLALILKPIKNRKHCNFKKLEIRLDGFFHLPEETDKEYVDEVVPYNCLAILYGIMRGIVSSMSGNIDGPKIILPAVNINDMIKSKMQADKDKMEEAQKVD